MINTVKKPLVQAYLDADTEEVYVEADKEIGLLEVLSVVDLLVAHCDTLGFKRESVIKYLNG